MSHLLFIPITDKRKFYQSYYQNRIGCTYDSKDNLFFIKQRIIYTISKTITRVTFFFFQNFAKKSNKRNNRGIVYMKV